MIALDHKLNESPRFCFTAIDQAFLLWGALTFVIFSLGQFSPLSWTASHFRCSTYGVRHCEHLRAYVGDRWPCKASLGHFALGRADDSRQYCHGLWYFL